MTVSNLGRIGFVLKGEWIAGTFKYLDVVKHNQSTWICAVPTTTAEPGSNADWQNALTAPSVTGVCNWAELSGAQMPPLIVYDDNQYWALFSPVSNIALNKPVASPAHFVPLVTVINNTLTSTATNQALSAAQGKVLQDTKQDNLVSGVSIKTINNVSLLGSGNLAPSLVNSIFRSARTGNMILGVDDSGKLIDITSGTFAQTFSSPATLGNGWWCYIRNSGTGDVTLSPASGGIDGLTSYIMYPGEVRLVQCDGATLRTVVLNSFYKKFTVSGTFTKPPGYIGFEVEVLGGGAGGSSGKAGRITKASSTFGGAGGGAAGVRRAAHSINSNLLPQNVPVVVGAGGKGGVGNNVVGEAGGGSHFNTLLTLSSSSNDIPRISSLVSSGSAGGAGGSASWTAGGWNATGHPGGSGAYIGSGVPVPSGGAGSTPTGVYLQNTTETFTYTGQPGGSTSVPFCSGAGGGSAAISYSSDTFTGTINVTGGAGGDGGLGAGGGGGGHALCSDEGNHFYSSPTLNTVSGKGGNGGSGLVQVWGII